MVIRDHEDKPVIQVQEVMTFEVLLVSEVLLELPVYQVLVCQDEPVNQDCQVLEAQLVKLVNKVLWDRMVFVIILTASHLLLLRCEVIRKVTKEIYMETNTNLVNSWLL